MKIQIVIPAYNEAAQLPELLENLDRVLRSSDHDHEIIVVDDGSSDGTGEIARNGCGDLKITVLNHEVNKGVSAAFRTGFDYVLAENSSGETWVITMEANKNADPDLIPVMCEIAGRGSDLVLASCYAPGGRVIGDPPLRLLMSKGINLILRLLFPAGVHTYTSFYRLWKIPVLRTLRLKTNGRYFVQEGFVCMADMLIKTSRLPDVTISEIPLVLQSDIAEAGSKMKTGKTIMGYLRLIVANICRS